MLTSEIAGIEPTHAILKTAVLPLNYIPKKTSKLPDFNR